MGFLKIPLKGLFRKPFCKNPLQHTIIENLNRSFIENPNTFHVKPLMHAIQPCSCCSPLLNICRWTLLLSKSKVCMSIREVDLYPIYTIQPVVKPV